MAGFELTRTLPSELTSGGILLWIPPSPNSRNRIADPDRRFTGTIEILAGVARMSRSLRT